MAGDEPATGVRGWVPRALTFCTCVWEGGCLRTSPRAPLTRLFEPSPHSTFWFQVLPLLVFWAFNLSAKGEGPRVCRLVALGFSACWAEPRACWKGLGLGGPAFLGWDRQSWSPLGRSKSTLVSAGPEREQRRRGGQGVGVHQGKVKPLRGCLGCGSSLLAGGAGEGGGAPLSQGLSGPSVAVVPQW